MAYSQIDFLDAINKVITEAVPEFEFFSIATGPNQSPPYILATIVGDVPSIYFGTQTDDFRILLQIDIYDRRDGTSALSGGFRELNALAERVKTALHKKKITVANGGNVTGWCTRRGTCRNENDNVNRITHEFVFLGSEN